MGSACSFVIFDMSRWIILSCEFMSGNVEPWFFILWLQFINIFWLAWCSCIDWDLWWYRLVFPMLAWFLLGGLLGLAFIVAIRIVGSSLYTLFLLLAGERAWCCLKFYLLEFRGLWPAGTVVATGSLATWFGAFLFVGEFSAVTGLTRPVPYM